MAMMDVPRCQHLKVNGTQCGCPALRRRRYCYFHTRVYEQNARMKKDQSGLGAMELPLLEDANAVQMALMEVVQRLAWGRIDHKTSGQILYALQTASSNLKSTTFEPAKENEVVIDRSTVGLTCIGGPQWLETEFGGREQRKEKTEEEEWAEADVVQGRWLKEVEEAEKTENPEQVKKADVTAQTMLAKWMEVMENNEKRANGTYQDEVRYKKGKKAGGKGGGAG
jgi:hypothetical protein